MNSPESTVLLQSLHRASDVGSVASVREQLAVVRAVIDEIERALPSG